MSFTAGSVNERPAGAGPGFDFVFKKPSDQVYLVSAEGVASATNIGALIQSEQAAVQLESWCFACQPFEA